MSLPESLQESLLERRNVVGVGLDEDGDVRVYVTEKLPEDKLDPEDIVPEKVDLGGIEVETHVVGTGVPRTLNRKDRHRPVPAGVSGGHAQITAGTIGTPPVTPVDGSGTYILTNAHVAAPIDESNMDDVFLQPGPFDDGSMQDQVGRLADWSDISKDGKNYSDSALIEVYPKTFKDNKVEGIGSVDMLDHKVQRGADKEFVKAGRTTGVTRGKRLETDVTILVKGYFSDEYAKFVDVDGFEGMSAGGDSGSLIGYEDDKGRFVGTHLLFAGSPYRTFGIPLMNVFNVHGEFEIAHPPSTVSWWLRWLKRGR